MFPDGWVQALARNRVVIWTPFPAVLASAGDATGRSSLRKTSAEATMRTPVLGPPFRDGTENLTFTPIEPAIDTDRGAIVT